jgi:hypothetical protein
MNPTVELVLKHKKANMRKSDFLMLEALKSAPHLNDKGSGGNKKLPPRRFSTVGIVREFRRSPTQPPTNITTMHICAHSRK